MSARDTIFSKIEAATESFADRTTLPDLENARAFRSRFVPDSEAVEALEHCFERAWTSVRGKLVRSEPELIELLKRMGARKGYLDSSISAPVLTNAFEVTSHFDRERVDEYDFGISIATCGIAETGTIALLDRDTPNRLGALAPWIHVAVLEKTKLRARLYDALPDFANDPSVVLVTGPSKTADIEGIMIEGVHGPGEQICWLV